MTAAMSSVLLGDHAFESLALSGVQRPRRRPAGRGAVFALEAGPARAKQEHQDGSAQEVPPEYDTGMFRLAAVRDHQRVYCRTEA